MLALVRLQPGERARFPCGEIPAAVPDGLSVPVVRSGNTGKSRFLEASLPMAVPIPFQDPARSVSDLGPKRDGDHRPHSARTASDVIAGWLLVGAAAAASHRGWRAVAAVAGAFTGVLSFRFGHHDAGPAVASSLLASLANVRVRSLGLRLQRGDPAADGRGPPSSAGAWPHRSRSGKGRPKQGPIGTKLECN